MIEISKLDFVVINALNRITESYYATIFNDIRSFEAVFKNRTGEIIGESFYRYSERVFCYELYHQLRIEIDNNVNDLFKGVLVQGEVKKMNIVSLLNKIGLDAFEKDFIPDILIHNPPDKTNQLCAIEVKTINNLNEEQVSKDLKKLNTYCESLNYENAYFICVNTSPKHIENILESIDCNNYCNKIKVICKENHDVNPKIWQIKQ